MSDTKTTGRKSPEYAPKSPEHGTSGGESKDSKKSDSKSDSKESKSSSKSESKSSSKSEQRRQERSEKRASFFDKPGKQTEKSAENQDKPAKEPDQQESATPVSDTEQASDKHKDGPIDVTEDPRFADKQPDAADTEEVEEPTDIDVVDDLAIDQYFDEAEQLSEQEVHDALEGLVESRTHDIAHELHDAQPNSPDEFEALADAAFLESIRDRVDGPDDITEAVLDEAYQETINDLELNTEEDPDQFDPEQPNDTEALGAEEHADVDDDPLNVAPPTVAGSGAGGSGGSGSGRPPVPPIPPTHPPGGPGHPAPPPHGGPPGGGSPPPPPPGPGAAPPAPPTGPSASSINRYNSRKRRTYLLRGALVGYIIGRRGGRKRTEKKLEPKIDKLEEQVTVLTEQVAEREEKIRSIARKTAEREAVLTSSAHAAEKPKQVAARKENLAARRLERKEMRKEIEKRDELAHSKAEAVGALGKLNLSSAEVFHEKRAFKELTIGGEEVPRKSVETMTKDELLIVIGDLQYDGVTVREMVAGGRLEVSALREVVKQYMRGEKAGANERFEKTLLRELKPDQKELDTKRSVVDRLHLDHPIARAGEHMKDLMPSHMLPSFMQPGSSGARVDHGASLETAGGKKKRRSPNPLLPVWIVVVVTLAVIGFVLLFGRG